MTPTATDILTAVSEGRACLLVPPYAVRKTLREQTLAVGRG